MDSFFIKVERANKKIFIYYYAVEFCCGLEGSLAARHLGLRFVLKHMDGRTVFAHVVRLRLAGAVGKFRKWRAKMVPDL